MAAYIAADENTRLYASSYYNANYMIYYALDYRPSFSLQQVLTTYVNEQVAENPFPEEKPPRISNPRPANYEGGADDPQYIADRAEYVEKERIYYNWYVADLNYKYAIELDGLELIGEDIPDVAAFANVVQMGIQANKDYDEDSSNKAGATATMAAFEELSDLAKRYIDKYSRSLYAITRETSTAWSYTNFRASKLVELCSDILNEVLVFDFIDVIDGMSPPYSREDIDTAKASYNLIPTSLRTRIPAETTAKYKEILASIAPDIPSTDIPEIEGKPQTTPNYPAGISKETLESQHQNLANLVFELLDIDVSTLLSESIYTNAAVASVAKFLFPTMADLSSLVTFTPADMLAGIPTDEFPGAHAALLAAVSEFNDKGEPVKNLDDWNNVVFESGDWNFEDGDREGFTDAVSALFRGLSILTLAITFENKISTTNGTYTYHAYEDLLPVLEALDLRGVMSSHEYTLYVNDESEFIKKMDRRIRPILVPIFNLLDDIAADPMAGILDLLPKFAMLLNENILNDQIAKIVSEFSFISVDEPDLTTVGLFNIIAPKLEELELVAAETDEEGNEITPAVTLGLQLSEENFVQLIEDLAGCGTYSVRDSIRHDSIYTIGIDSEQTDAYLTLFNWLYGELSVRNNINAVRNAITALDLGTFESLAISLVLETIYRTPPSHLMSILNFIIPLARIILSFANFMMIFELKKNLHKTA